MTEYNPVAAKCAEGAELMVKLNVYINMLKMRTVGGGHTHDVKQ
jgi:hypothetical protein